MRNLFHDLSHAREMIDVNIAAGVAWPRIKALGRQLAIVAFLAVAFLAGVSWKGYTETNAKLDRYQAERRAMNDQAQADRALVIAMLEKLEGDPR